MHFDARHTSHFFPQTCTRCSSIYWKIHPFPYWFEMPPFPFPVYLVHFVSLMGLSLCYYHTSSTFHSFSDAPSGRPSAPTLVFSFLFIIPDALRIILSSSKSPACILRAWDLYIDLWWTAGIESDFSIVRVCPPTWQPLCFRLPWFVLGIYLNTISIEFLIDGPFWPLYSWLLILLYCSEHVCSLRYRFFGILRLPLWLTAIFMFPTVLKMTRILLTSRFFIMKRVPWLFKSSSHTGFCLFFIIFLVLFPFSVGTPLFLPEMFLSDIDIA